MRRSNLIVLTILLRIDEAAQKGKFEYKLVLPPGAEPGSVEKEKSIERILSLPPTVLAKSLFMQCKIAEESLQELETIKESEKRRLEASDEKLMPEDDAEAKFAELTKERAILEKRINAVMEQEKSLQIRFGKIAEIVEALSDDKHRDLPRTDLKKKIVFKSSLSCLIVGLETGMERIVKIQQQ